MNKKLLRAAVVFAAIAISGVVLVAMSPDYPARVASVLAPVGAALFAGALAFFLVEAFELTER